MDLREKININMKSNKKTLLITSTVGLLLFVFSMIPLNFDGSKNKAVQIYYVDNISETHQKIIDDFNELHKNKIEVVPIDIPFYKFSTNERKELLMRALRSNSEKIDVFAADLVWIKRFAKWAEPLDRYFSDEELMDITPYALNTCYIEGELVATPLYMDVSMMFYRKDLLATLEDHEQIEAKLKESMTWKEFIELSNRIDKKENYYIFPAEEFEGLICSLTELILTQKKNYFTENPSYTDETCREAVELLVDLVNQYKISPKEVINFKEPEAYASFIQNDGLFLRAWQSSEKDTKNLIRNAAKEIHIGQAQLPHLEGAEIGSTIGGWNLMLAENSNHKKESLTFIKYILSKNVQGFLYENGAFLPVLKHFYSDKEFIKQNPNIELSYKILQEGEFRPKLHDYTHISNVLSHYIRLAIKNEISIETALAKAQKDILKQLPGEYD